ncbi:TPA: hypothetical protein RTG57_001747 [Campylobacter jejuni]|nr:hypothetical protein [Campylobacter jejuni]
MKIDNNIKNGILIYKWGRPTDAFTVNNKNNINVGRGFDLVIEFVAEVLIESKNISFVEICTEGRTSKAEVPSKYIFIDNSKKGFKQSKANKIIVLGGPDNDEFNKEFVDYINNSFNGDIYLYTNDHKFLELKGIKKPYSINTELIQDKIFSSQYSDSKFEAKSNIGFTPWLAKNIYESTKFENILILANELHSDYEHSRVPRILKYCKNNPDLQFDLYGLYDDAKNIETLKNIKNLNFYNTQFSHKELYTLMRNYKYSLIIQASECEGSVYNEDICYPINYVCLKFYEYLLNDVIPFVDYTYNIKDSLQFYSYSTILKNFKDLTSNLRLVKEYESIYLKRNDFSRFVDILKSVYLKQVHNRSIYLNVFTEILGESNELY